MKSLGMTAAVLLSCSIAALGAEPETELPLGLCFVPEMQFIPEVDSWQSCEPGAYAEAVKAVEKAWPKEAKRIAKHVTPELARTLSRWAQPQMAAYAKVPPLEKVSLEPVAHYSQRKKIVLKGTVDTLPVHAPLVTRWLQVYVLADTSGEIDRVTVTIRGEVQE